ncbi:DNA-directed RNA polymerase ii subunit rpb1 [Seiridium cupressi]|uniref:G-patch domain-containing protein n=1 Tax=Seiridium unicorne TaxID=138068 RepID=A0ABR2VC01_9PEZI
MSKLDAHALLTSQGWRGKGHSLHPTDDGTGLKHHILIKREGSDGRGLGSRKDHKQEAWWMNAFDQALKGIDTTSGSMKQTTSGGKLDLEKITARGLKKYTGNSGLYTCFVKGGLLKGSVEQTGGLLTPPDSGTGTPAAEERQETAEEKRTRRAEKKSRKAEKALKTASEERAKTKAEHKAQKKAQKKAAKEALKAGETKEQRRARREARRVRKAEKRRKRHLG